MNIFQAVSLFFGSAPDARSMLDIAERARWLNAPSTRSAPDIAQHASWLAKSTCRPLCSTLPPTARPPDQNPAVCSSPAEANAIHISFCSKKASLDERQRSELRTGGEGKERGSEVAKAANAPLERAAISGGRQGRCCQAACDVGPYEGSAHDHGRQSCRGTAHAKGSSHLRPANARSLSQRSKCVATKLGRSDRFQRIQRGCAITPVDQPSRLEERASAAVHHRVVQTLGNFLWEFGAIWERKRFPAVSPVKPRGSPGPTTSVSAVGQLAVHNRGFDPLTVFSARSLAFLKSSATVPSAALNDLFRRGRASSSPSRSTIFHRQNHV